MSRSARTAISALAAILCVAGVLFAADREAVKFSKNEILLLKRLDQIQTGANVLKSMLKAAPFAQLVGSTSLIDMTITVSTNDWDQIFGALTALNKIESCKTVEAIDLWKEVDGNEFSSAETETFFKRIRSKADTRCR
jgi:hypothetical protein